MRGKRKRSWLAATRKAWTAAIILIAAVTLLLLAAGCTESATSAETEAGPDVSRAAEDYVTVLHPFHSSQGDVCLYTVVAELDAEAGLLDRDLPGVVPAYRVTWRPLPETDLTFEESSSPSREGLPALYTNPTAEALIEPREHDAAEAPPLGDEAWALKMADEFLRAHNLNQPDLGLGEVHVGSSIDDGHWRVTSWQVGYPQIYEQESPILLGGLSVRVAPGGEVSSLRWSLVDLKDAGAIRLRPLAEVLADRKAWQEGFAADGLNDLYGEVDLQVRDVEIVFRPPEGNIIRADTYLAPVYSFGVEVTAPEEHRGLRGWWDVVAAVDVER